VDGKIHPSGLVQQGGDSAGLVNAYAALRPRDGFSYPHQEHMKDTSKLDNFETIFLYLYLEHLETMFLYLYLEHLETVLYTFIWIILKLCSYTFI